ncbi:MAG: hypothetical protein KAV00_04260, partial [Phycisphaerae bacterium]|nr:hypothetical protein [Phycisphaerae bacterium]
MSVTGTMAMLLTTFAVVILASVTGGLAGNPASKKSAAKTKPADTADAEMLKTLGISSAYLDKKIKHISNAELFRSMDLTRPGLEDVSKAVKSRDYKSAYRAWSAYWAKRYQVKPPLPQKMSGKRLLERAAKIMRHEICGWGDVMIKHGPVVNFNANYGSAGKYGFHYWGWSQTLLQAYQATRDEKYLACFDELFNQWYEQRDSV